MVLDRVQVRTGRVDWGPRDGAVDGRSYNVLVV